MVLPDWRTDGSDFTACFELVVVEILIGLAVILGSSTFGGVFDEAAPGVPVLRAESIIDDARLLYRFIRDRTFLCAIVSADFPLRRPVQKVFKVAALAAVDAGSKSAVGIHVALAGCDEGGKGVKLGFGYAVLTSHHGRQRLIITLVNGGRHLGIVGIDLLGFGADFDLLLHVAKLQAHILSESLTRGERNARGVKGLETLE